MRNHMVAPESCVALSFSIAFNGKKLQQCLNSRQALNSIILDLNTPTPIIYFKFLVLSSVWRAHESSVGRTNDGAEKKCFRVGKS